MVFNRLKRPALVILPNENTHDLLQNKALPTLRGSTWCKRWHHGGIFFANCIRRGSQMNPPPAMSQGVGAMLVLDHNTKGDNVCLTVTRHHAGIAYSPLRQILDLDLSGRGKFLARELEGGGGYKQVNYGLNTNFPLLILCLSLCLLCQRPNLCLFVCPSRYPYLPTFV